MACQVACRGSGGATGYIASVRVCRPIGPGPRDPAQLGMLDVSLGSEMADLMTPVPLQDFGLRIVWCSVMFQLKTHTHFAEKHGIAKL